MARPLCVNVASSRHLLPGFDNLDTSVFYRLAKLPRFVLAVFPRRYADQVEDYRRALSSGSLVMRDCRKPLPYAPETIDHILCSHFLEHVYPDECRGILRDFHRKLKPGGTVHVIVPDLEQLVETYREKKGRNDPDAANWFVRKTILSRDTRGSRKYRVLEATGRYGLQHRWMYDKASMRAALQEVGFEILDRNDTPSAEFRKDDGSVHLVGRKPARS